jgi:hypothetical protein
VVGGPVPRGLFVSLNQLIRPFSPFYDRHCVADGFPPFGLQNVSRGPRRLGDVLFERIVRREERQAARADLASPFEAFYTSALNYLLALTDRIMPPFCAYAEAAFLPEPIQCPLWRGPAGCW